MPLIFSDGQVLKITLPAKPVLTIGQVSSIDASSETNSCKDIVNIAFMENGSSETTISIYDITGRVVMGNKTINTTAYNVDVSMLKDGIYFIEFFDENKKTLQHLKLMKEQ